MLKYIKEFFKKPVPVPDYVRPSRQELINNLDYNKFDLPTSIDRSKDKTLLLVDDVELSALLYKADFDGIRDVYGLDIENEYNEIKSLGQVCGYSSIKYIKTTDIKITHAILDLTLGHIEMVDGVYLEVDGVDVAIELYKHNPDIKILFSTAHSLDNKNATVKYYFNKLKEFNGHCLLDFYLNKNTDRKEKIYELLIKD